ncbi:MAG: HD domain-containing protein [Candidatus Accumulibacter sp.]|uniref:HD-GYP domain-containing protein n=1 Tax=Accumulibacter sp. TaxID=2053492 RepID=UPI001A4D657C|nr:HD domain-containing phosphohydrolase [Accumulibacter sp.]MBL8393397.1 HD domain-containing protein [Accumulibacter sp.]
MDKQTTPATRLAEPEAVLDFAEALRDYAPAIERDVSRLRLTPGDREAIGSLFRGLHNIKGDAALCRVDLAVAMVHPMEALLDRVRRNELPFTAAIAELILLLLDRLEVTITRLACGQDLADLQLGHLTQGLESLVCAKGNELGGRTSAIIEAVTGFHPVGGASLAAVGERATDNAGQGAQASDDLRFFRVLAHQFEARSPRFKGRTARIVRLALDTNQQAGTVIDPQQLEAAVYMHDVGMMFVEQAIWLKSGEMSAADRQALRSHPMYAAELLSRMAGWSPAAQMVAQHHEMPDGKGYPHGLSAAAICPGARLLAIVDAFEAVMSRHDDRRRNRSVLRAIAEINACDKQFAPEWIAQFNQVIHRTLAST